MSNIISINEINRQYDRVMMDRKEMETTRKTLRSLHDFLLINKELLWGNGIDQALRDIRQTMTMLGIKYPVRVSRISTTNIDNEPQSNRHE